LGRWEAATAAAAAAAVSRGTSFFLQKKLTDFLQQLGLDVLSFIAGWARTYGD
jgi:hypothetical protein